MEYFFPWYKPEVADSVWLETIGCHSRYRVGLYRFQAGLGKERDRGVGFNGWLGVCGRGLGVSRKLYLDGDLMCSRTHWRY